MKLHLPVASGVPLTGVRRAEASLEKSKLTTLPCRAVFAANTLLAILGDILIRQCPMLAASCFLVAVAAGQKYPQGSTSRDISELAPEDLMQLRVTSATDKEQPLSKVGAALYVITREDIASSGANNIPDLLRLVPGVEVAQINSNQWAISIRGFNSFSSNKVLALIDGRALYQSLYSGVLWDEQDLPLEDIERIEVIRGPGGTVWGANAMNGVINIITRHSRDTHGTLITVGAGSQRAGEGLLQSGGGVGPEGSYRAFAKYFDVTSSSLPDGQRASDGWHSWAGGFRSDWDLTPRDSLTVQGDLRETVEGGTSLATFSEPQPYQSVINSPIRNTLGDVMGTWRHTLKGGSETTLRIYYDRTERNGEAGIDVTNHTFDADFKHHLTAGRNDIGWGANLRVSQDNILSADSHSLHLIPESNASLYASGFFQDEIRISNSVFLTLGSKLEHNDYTGLEYEPGAQLVWTPSESNSLWVSASRAIRQPNQVDFGARFNLGVIPTEGLPIVVTLFGNHGVKTEKIHDYEIGYRTQFHPRLSLDLATFLSYYRDLETSEPGTPFLAANAGTAPHLVLPVTFGNLARARNYGAELFLHWTPVRRWTVSPGYSFLQMSVQPDAGSRDTTIGTSSGYSAKHHLQVGSVLSLRSNVELSATLRYVSRLATPNIPSYWGADSTVRWRSFNGLEVSVTGQNLLGPRHMEFGDLQRVLIPSQVQRSGYVKLAWRF